MVQHVGLEPPALVATAESEIRNGRSLAIDAGVLENSGHTVASGARTGSVTLFQRFGLALNLNIRLQILFLNGAYSFSTGQPVFHRDGT